MNDNMKNLCWSVEDLRTGGANGKTGETTPKAGSLLATINKTFGDWMEDQPQNLASMTHEIQKSISSLIRVSCLKSVVTIVPLGS